MPSKKLSLPVIDSDTLKATWLDDGRAPRCPPNPAFPNGIDLDIAAVQGAPFGTCKIELTHPAPRCGAWLIECARCHSNGLVTTAGRPDDPRSVRIPCLSLKQRNTQ